MRYFTLTETNRRMCFYFTPGINLLTSRCFAAEVRRLFPVSFQKYREYNTQSSREIFYPGMGEISAMRFLKSVQRAYQLNNKCCNIFIFVGFFLTSSPFKVAICTLTDWVGV